jgi:hypothetical protein
VGGLGQGKDIFHMAIGDDEDTQGFHATYHQQTTRSWAMIS